jgi:quinol monooxygenase YgiN
MDTNELCAVAHVDFRPSFADRGALIAAQRAGNGPVEAGEQVLRALVAAGHPPGTVDLAVLQQLSATNHFEVIGRFSSEAAYEAHLISAANLDYRRSVASALGSPYDDRLLSARGEQAWPGAGAGDFVVIMQVDIQPPRLDEALSLVDEVAAAQSADVAMGGQVLLQRRCRPSNLELISVWSSPGGVRGASRLGQRAGSALGARVAARRPDRLPSSPPVRRRVDDPVGRHQPSPAVTAVLRPG